MEEALKVGDHFWYFDGRTSPQRSTVAEVDEQSGLFTAETTIGTILLTKYSAFTDKQELLREVKMHINMLQSWIERNP